MKYKEIKYQNKKIPLKEIKKKSKKFYEILKTRRSIRSFKNNKIDDEIIKNAILTAGTAPNGANLQPWHFVVIKNNIVKKKIRKEAEKEELKFYKYKASIEWLEALRPLGTNFKKKFLEEAPILIVIFEQKYSLKNKVKLKNYYVKESVGIATGLLISCLHYSGLSMLTHTPNPMNFLNKILNRPLNEKPFMILVVGFPKKDCKIPEFALNKKTIEKITSWF